ncbi:anti-sigma factor [Chryseomicrobium palamuruense]
MNTKWNKDVEKRILRKSRFTLTFRILRILIAALILFAIYTSFLDAYGNTAKSFKKAHFYNELVIEWTNPNVRSVMAMPTWEVNLFGVGEVSYPLFKRVGMETIPVGEAKVTKSILPFLSKQEIQFDGKREYDPQEFLFYYGKHPKTGEELAPSGSPSSWQVLSMLPEGTVGEMAVSLEEMMSPEELVNKLADYDLGITWMALYTGEYQEGSSVQETSMEWGDGSQILTPPIPLGLTPPYEMEEDFMGSSFVSMLRATNAPTVIDAQRAMVENMEKVLAESVSYQEDYLGLYDLQERYDYIQENGFITFGAVVTGPVKELRKLQDEEGIHSPILGEVELWNWNNE